MATTKRGKKNTAKRFANAAAIVSAIVDKYSQLHDSGEYYWAVITGSDASGLSCYLVSVWAIDEGLVGQCMHNDGDGVFWDVTVEGKRILEARADDRADAFVTRFHIDESTVDDIETVLAKYDDVNKGFSGERCIAHKIRKDKAYRKADWAGRSKESKELCDFFIESPVTGRKVPCDVKTNLRSATTNPII